ncbi:MAG: Stf0 family sulfotransferase [Pseudomonadota bacterium]
MSGDLFTNPDFDMEAYLEKLTLYPARRACAIHFTPRSGSSWLTDIIGQTGRLGRALEAFNPNFLPNMVRAANASSRDQYIRMILRKHKRGDVYSFEITGHHLRRSFPRQADFQRYFGAYPSVWLIREDIVAQAISLAKMVTVKVAHAPQTSADAIRAGDARFAYDGAQIRHWVKHIQACEQISERLFAEYGHTPLRLSYERITGRTPEEVTGILARHIGLESLPPTPFETAHRKIATRLNADYADRFRARNGRFVDQVDRARARTLDALTPLPAAGASGG